MKKTKPINRRYLNKSGDFEMGRLAGLLLILLTIVVILVFLYFVYPNVFSTLRGVSDQGIDLLKGSTPQKPDTIPKIETPKSRTITINKDDCSSTSTNKPYHTEYACIISSAKDLTKLDQLLRILNKDLDKDLYYATRYHIAKEDLSCKELALLGKDMLDPKVVVIQFPIISKDGAPTQHPNGDILSSVMTSLKDCYNNLKPVSNFPLSKEYISNKKISFAKSITPTNDNDNQEIKSYLSLLLADPPCSTIPKEEVCLGLNKVYKGNTRCVWLDSISGTQACRTCSESEIKKCNDYCTIPAICIGDIKIKREDPCGVCND